LFQTIGRALALAQVCGIHDGAAGVANRHPENLVTASLEALDFPADEAVARLGILGSQVSEPQ
jgi:hypothetical protein